MTLPKINHPMFKLTVPSTKKEMRFRPFLVKEEKLLLMAKVSEKEADMMLAIKQVVNNCAMDDIDIDKLTLFDIEYLFLRIRAQSVNNIVSVSYRDYEDNQLYDFEIDLNTIEVLFPENIDKNIKLDAKSGFMMKYPEASIYEDKEFLKSGDESFFQLTVRCIDKFYDEDNVYPSKDYKLKEIEEFIENLDIKTFDKVREFMINQPKMSHTLNYKNTLGNDRSIELTTLNDFFTLR
jgi:hypothetical protein